MTELRHRHDAPVRSVQEVGPGDYVKLEDGWAQITTNTAYGHQRTPRTWKIRTADGTLHGMFDCYLYAKAEDILGNR